MQIKIVRDKINKEELREIAKEYYIDMVKGVVDVESGIVAFGGEYHMDANVLILKNGSKQADVWGFNIYFDKPREEWIEFTSLINIRPQAGNRTMEIENKKLREKIHKIVSNKII